MEDNYNNNNLNNNNNVTYSYGGSGNPVPNQGDNAYSTVPSYNHQYVPQTSQPQYIPHNTGYTAPSGGSSKGRKSFGVSVPTVIISIASAAVIGLAGGYIGAKLGGHSNETVIKSEDGTSVVFKAIDRTSDDGSQDSYSVEDIMSSGVADSVVEITTEVVSTSRFMGQYISQGAGSGVVFSADGYIMTNHHVIDGAQTITVTLRNGSSYPASIVGDDSMTDLALLKIDATGLTPAVIGNSDNLKVGQTAIAIGNPLGQLGGTVTSGIVSALDREIEIDGQTMNLLQTSAAINPGNSGGGLFDDDGNLIGIVNAKSSGSDIEGLGFAIPVNTVLDVFTDLREYGYVTGRVSLGVSVLSITNAQTAWMYGVNETGLYITRVENGSDAANAGLKSGDKIVSFNGKEIQSETELAAELKNCSVGDTVTMVVRRGGNDHTVSITLSESKG